MRPSLIFGSFQKIFVLIAISVAVIVSVVWVYLLSLSIFSVLGGMGYNLNSYSDFIPIIALVALSVFAIYGTLFSIKSRNNRPGLAIISSLAVIMSSVLFLYEFVKLLNY